MLHQCIVLVLGNGWCARTPKRRQGMKVQRRPLQLHSVVSIQSVARALFQSFVRAHQPMQAVQLFEMDKLGRQAQHARQVY